jgi:hypothetical protein
MADVVTQWHELSMQLVNEAVNYAKLGVFDEETDANIRAVRVTTNILLAALQQAQIPRPFVPPEMPSV